MIAETIITWILIFGFIFILSAAFHFLKFASSSNYRKEIKERNLMKSLILNKFNQLELNYDDELIFKELYNGLEIEYEMDCLEDFINNFKKEESIEFPDLQNIYTLIKSSFINDVEFELNNFMKKLYEKAKKTENKNEIDMSLKLIKSIKEMKEKFKHHMNFKQICKLSVNRARYNSTLKRLRDLENLYLEKLTQEEIKTIEKLKISIFNQNLHDYTKEHFKKYKNYNLEKIISIIFLIKELEDMSVEMNSSLINLKK
jgi:hypothetical protein